MGNKIMITTGKQILEMEEGLPVPAIEAKIANVWKRITGTNDNGEWSMQPVGLKIGSETIRATFWGYPPLNGDKGKSFRIESTKGEKGWHGITTVDNTWKMDNGKSDKPERELKITEAAKMLPLGQVDPEEDAQATPGPRANTPPPLPPLNSLERARDQLGRVNNAIYLCSRSVNIVVQQLKKEGLEFSDANIGGMNGQAFRAIDVDSLPVDPVWVPKPAETRKSYPTSAVTSLGADLTSTSVTDIADVFPNSAPDEEQEGVGYVDGKPEPVPF